MLTTYKKRSGTSDRGKDFEWLLCAFYSLKYALNDDVDYFEIYSNNEFFGDLDDVILRVKYVDNSVEVFLLQQKHSEKKKTVSKDSLVAENGEFSLFKYRKSYHNILSLDYFKCILYTNKVANFQDKTKLKFDNQDIFIRRETCIGRGLLNTNTTRQCSVFRFDANCDQEFFNRFYVYVNQQNDINLKESISKLLQSTLQCDVYSTFIQFMRDWWAGNFRMRKYDVIAKLAELAFSPMIRPLTDEKSNEKSELIKEAILKSDISSIENDEEYNMAKIWPETSLQRDMRQISLTALKYGLITKGINKIEELSTEKMSLVLWYLNQVPLIVEIHNLRKTQILSAVQLLGRCKNKKKIVIIGKLDLGEHFNGWKIFKDLSDLPVSDDLRRRIVKGLSCSLQGKKKLSLDELGVYDNKLTSIFSLEQLLKMALEDDFNIGEDLESLPPVYIPRSFFKVLFDYDVVDGADLKMMLSCKGQLDTVQTRFRKRFMKITCKQTVVEHDKYYLYGCEDEFSKEELENYLETTRRIFHHFRIHSNTSLQWLCSTHYIYEYLNFLSEFNNLKKYRKANTTHFFKESEVDAHIYSPLRIVTAATGGGKSSLLNNIKNQALSRCFVIKMNLKEHSRFFNDNQEVEKVWDYILDFTCRTRKYNAFEVNFLRNFLKENVILLWDGYEELQENLRNFFEKCVKYLLKKNVTQWITSTDHLKSLLEKSFYVFALTMTPLEKEQQKFYIQERLEVRDPEVIEEFFKNINIIDNSEYLGIPLQLYILTDIFNQNIGNLRNIFTLTDMCSHFIDGKYSHFLKNRNCDVYSLGELIEDGKKHRLEQYKIAALKTYLPEVFKTLNIDNTSNFNQQIRKGDIFGLIVKISEDNCFEFEYNIFGQYLCALWLSENLHQLNSFLFTVKNRNIKFMFDLLLADKRPIFISLLYKKFDDLPNCEIVKDNGGRNPLHVICTYGKDHPLVSTEKSRYSYYEDFKEEEVEVDESDSEALKSAILYLRTKCNVSEKDDLLNWTPYEYADRSLCLGLIEILPGPLGPVLSTLHNYKHSATVLYYSSKHNYKNLFDAIKHSTYFEFSKGDSLLHVTSEFGREDFLKWLLQSKNYLKFVNRSDVRKWTPMHFASFNGHLSIMKYLKEKGATFRLSEPSTLSLAVRKKYQTIVEFLVQCDVNINDFHHDNYLTQSLSVAISRGFIEIVEFLVQNGAKLYSIGKNSMSALHLALEKGQIEIAKFLLSRGVNIDEIDGSGMNSYHHAAINNQKLVVNLLLEQKATFSVLDENKRSPLHYAAQHGSVDVAKLLIDAKIDVNTKDIFECTPLHLACQYGQVAITRLLIEAGCEMNPVDKYRRTPLHQAAINGVAKGVEILYNNGAFLECEDTLYKRRPLHYAAWNGHEDCVKVLIEKEALVDPICHFSFTPLHLAVESNNFEVCQLLVDAGASVFVKNSNGSTPLNLIDKSNYVICSLILQKHEHPLHEAVKENMEEVIPELLALGYSINEIDENGATPLHLAVGRPQTLSLIQTLLQKGADVTMTDFQEYIPLHYALFSAFIQKEYVEALLNADVDNVTINKGTKEGLTSLHIASQAGFHLSYPYNSEEISVELVKLLLNKGAKVDAIDDEGFTSLHYAARSGNLEIFKLLVGKGLRIDQANRNGRTVLHMAATQNFLPMVKYLLSENASISTTDKDGDTPLDDALKAEHPRVYVELLGSNIFKSNLEATNHKGRTVLHLAIKQNLSDLVDLCIFHKVSLDMADCDGNTPIDDAVFSHRLDICELLLNQTSNYDINKYNEHHKFYLLHFAVSCNSLQMVQFILNRKVKGDVTDKEGNTSLHYAAKTKRINGEIVTNLLDHDSNITNKINKCGQTALHLAVTVENKHVIKILTDKGAKIDVRDNDGNVPFDLCLKKSDIFNVEELLLPLEDFDVNKRMGNFGTLLHHAVEFRDEELTKWLIKRGACINLTDTKGCTPLHLACRHADTVRLFLDKYGALIDFKAKTTNGKTVLDLASRLPMDLVKRMLALGASFEDAASKTETLLYNAMINRNTELFKFLLNANPSVNVVNMITDLGDTVLHFAASEGDVELVKLLLDKGAEIHSVSRQASTPLSDAADNGYLKVLELLLDKDEKGEMVNIAYQKGRTLLHTAAKEGNLELVKLLVRKGAKVDLYDNDGRTAAEIAAVADKIEVHRFLVEMMENNGE